MSSDLIVCPVEDESDNILPEQENKGRTISIRPDPLLRAQMDVFAQQAGQSVSAWVLSRLEDICTENAAYSTKAIMQKIDILNENVNLLLSRVDGEHQALPSQNTPSATYMGDKLRESIDKAFAAELAMRRYFD